MRSFKQEYSIYDNPERTINLIKQICRADSRRLEISDELHETYEPSQRFALMAEGAALSMEAVLLKHKLSNGEEK